MDLIQNNTILGHPNIFKPPKTSSSQIKSDKRERQPKIQYGVAEAAQILINAKSDHLTN